MHSTLQAVPVRRPSPAVAVLLAFLLPGLGQAYAGQRRRALLWAVPTLAVLAVLLALFVLHPDVGYVVGLLLQPEALLLVLVVDLALIVYRVAAIVDAYRVARDAGRTSFVVRRTARLGIAVAAVLVTVTVGAQGLVAWVDWNTYDLVNSVFAGGDANGPNWGDGGAADAGPSTSGQPASGTSTGGTSTGGTSAASGGPSAPGDTGSASTPGSGAAGSPAGSPAGSAAVMASPSPAATDSGIPYWARDGRLDVLVLGGDAGPGREGLRTDSMMLLSVDVASGRAAIFGFPRNLTNVPLPARIRSAYGCHCFPDMLSGYYRWAQSHPDLFAGSLTTRGYRALAELYGSLTGRTIDAVVAADLNGFVKVIDALGGLRIDVPYRIHDAKYPKEDGSGTMVLDIAPGPQVLSGSLALAFARTRHQDSDYGRMSRQQMVLVALRKQITPCAMIPRLPDLVKVAKESLWTNLPSAQLPSLLALAEKVDTKRIARFAFTPPTYGELVTAGDVSRIQATIRDAFKGAPPAPEPGDDGGFLHC